MGGYRRDDDTEEFEAKIEFTSAKAYLVEMTLGGKYWLPKSQVYRMDEPDGDGNRVFEVSSWWWGKKEPVPDDR